MIEPPGNWCIGCGALDSEPAAEGCSNPIWHLPHFRGQIATPEPSRKRRVRLPYAGDDEDETGAYTVDEKRTDLDQQAGPTQEVSAPMQRLKYRPLVPPGQAGKAV